MTRTRGFVAAILASAALAGAATSAEAKISAAIAIPDSEVIINLNNTGLDWVYAGPIAPNEFGPGNIEPASYRAAEGWRIATAAEWALRPTWTDFVRPGFAAPAPSCGFTDHSSYRFTSEYWSDYAHVDLCDAASDRFTDGVNGVVSGVPETIYVRTSAAAGAVPEPAAWAMMLGGFGLLGGVARRRSRATVTFA
jgi:hypothetical protein